MRKRLLISIRFCQYNLLARVFVYSLIACTGSHLSKAGTLPELLVPRVTASAVKIDGEVRESAWARAPIITLHNYWPSHPIEESTKVRILHTGSRLLVSFVCEDRDIVARHTVKDDHTFRDDCVEIFLAAPLPNPLHEGLNVEISASRAWADVLFRSPNWLNYDWNPPGIEVAVARTANGWTAEVSLPFSDIADVVKINGYDRFLPREEQDFRQTQANLRAVPVKRIRANFARWHRPENALTIWSNPRHPTPHPVVLNRYGWLLLE